MNRYWLGVVSKEHVDRGVKEGIAQVCRGKKGPLSRMKAGDGMIYYSPKITMGGKDPCQCFTAVGKIRDGKFYQVEMAPDFHPFRIDVDYFPCKKIPIKDLLDELEFTSGKNWGMVLRRGLIELSAPDFRTIAHAMGVKW